MEKKIENEMETLGPLKGVHRDITPRMEKANGKENGNWDYTGLSLTLLGNIGSCANSFTTCGCFMIQEGVTNFLGPPLSYCKVLEP